MANETLDLFTDWCYNEFVRLYREKKFREASIFHETLLKHSTWNLCGRRLVSQRMHAKGLIKDIEKAGKAGKTEKLLFTGQKGRDEFIKTITEYEKALRNEGYPENVILDLVIIKKEEYGN